MDILAKHAFHLELQISLQLTPNSFYLMLKRWLLKNTNNWLVNCF